MFDSLGDRMKEYESANSSYLTRRMPVIIRLDMVAAHTFCRGLEKPFDDRFMTCMQNTTMALCKAAQGCKVAYTQSDEISLILTDYDTIKTDAWFKNKIQKLVSVSASIASVEFNREYRLVFSNEFCTPSTTMFMEEDRKSKWEKQAKMYTNKINSAIFDSRVFNLPKEEVCNYFIWRQNDATRNSILGYGQSMFSHKELQGKSCNEIQEMMYQKFGINWDKISVDKKRGVCLNRIKGERGWVLDKNIPQFTQDREYIEKYLLVNLEG